MNQSSLGKEQVRGTEGQYSGLEDRLKDAPWRFTPYGGNPHEYIVSSWSPECKSLVFTVRQLILEGGYTEMFYRTPWQYLDIGDHHYFAGTGDIAQADREFPTAPFVLNRKPLKED